MASSLATQHFCARNKVEMWDHDPNGTSATVVTPDAGTTKRYVALRDYDGFVAVAMSSTLTGNGITLLEIVAAEDATGTNATQIKTSGVVACDAVGDFVVEEATAEEINALGKASGYDFTHVAARLTVANAADEAVVTYIRYGAKRATADLTADTISS
jgi:hypothetical protein